MHYRYCYTSTRYSCKAVGYSTFRLSTCGRLVVSGLEPNLSRVCMQGPCRDPTDIACASTVARHYSCTGTQTSDHAPRVMSWSVHCVGPPNQGPIVWIRQLWTCRRAVTSGEESAAVGLARGECDARRTSLPAYVWHIAQLELCTAAIFHGSLVSTI